MSIKTGKCAFCGAEVEIIDRVGRLEECTGCGKYLHSCLQCKLYDRSFHNQCRESQAPYVSDKENANFCEFFEFGREVEAEKKNIGDAKKKLESLFRKG
jgi:hypothetical protein